MIEEARNRYDKLFGNKEIFKDDPDMNEIFGNFAFDEVLKNTNLTDRQQMLVILASHLAIGSVKGYKLHLAGALNLKVSPLELRELLYQVVPYIGMAKAYDFFEATNLVFKEKGIEVPSASTKTVTRENRFDKGLAVQESYFGKDNISAMRENAPRGQKHFQDFLSDYCFGDFYTREGLSDSDRELITFSLIASLGGCENQLRGHTAGNLSVGNDKDVLIGAVTVLCPYIGFPRTLNALNIINEVCKGGK